MTIYLWGNVAIFVAGAAVSTEWMPSILTFNDVTAGLSRLLLALAVIAVAVLAVGWVEDVAARRAPRLNPWPSRPAEQRAMALGEPPRPASASSQPHITMHRRRLAGTLLMAGLAGVIALFWTASDPSGVMPKTTERGQTPITALDEQPPAPPAEPAVPSANGEPIPPPAPSTSSDTGEDSPPGNDVSPPPEENVVVPDAAAAPEDGRDVDPTQAPPEATSMPQPTPTPTSTPQPTPTSTPQPTPTPTSTPQPTATPTQQPRPTQQPTPTQQPGPTQQPTPTPTPQATPTPESEPTPSQPVAEEPIGETP
jgi:hypothetical protein